MGNVSNEVPGVDISIGPTWITFRISVSPGTESRYTERGKQTVKFASLEEPSMLCYLIQFLQQPCNKEYMFSQLTEEKN